MKNPTLSERLQLLQHFGDRYGLDAPSMASLEETVRRNWYRELSGAQVQNLCQEAAMKLIRSKITMHEQK
jgi:ATP-dependent 26S proteasome regulatory subunit